jgi:hypothetical protein
MFTAIEFREGPLDAPTPPSPSVGGAGNAREMQL